MVRPGGLSDPQLLVSGAARDVVTNRQGVTVVAVARVDTEVRYDNTRELVAIETHPVRPRTSSLLGRPVASGFRAAADAALDPGDPRGPLSLLLDDLPVAVLIAGYAHALTRDLPVGAEQFRPMVDLCSGWRDGGTMIAAVRAGGPVPLRPGPDAPPVERPDDPFAWHATQPLPPLAMRRRRRVDLVAGEGQVHADAMFRDTYADREGRETVVHEYALRAVLDAEGTVVREIAATPRVLPAPECPLAADSAERLVGTPIADIAEQVRRDLRGTSTCTHLNDLLRSLGAIPILLAALRGQDA
jgi:hypothetical protein